jgi:hypothetical protein
MNSIVCNHKRQPCRPPFNRLMAFSKAPLKRV